MISPATHMQLAQNPFGHLFIVVTNASCNSKSINPPILAIQHPLIDALSSILYMHLEEI